ncbi:MAG: hypothetical protein QOG99_3088 [Frankiales bacterium]|nr:hypothetical protein [Frankiales bacterium]
MSTYRVITSWTGFCASCPAEQPLLLVSHGPHGVRAWLSGAGHEDRTLSYACSVCGRVEFVPATEDEDVYYDATLARWPDWIEEAFEPVLVTAPFVPLVEGDVFALAAVSLTAHPEPVAPQLAAVASVPASAPVSVPVSVPAPRSPAVRVVTMPLQRVSPTDLVAAAA